MRSKLLGHPVVNVYLDISTLRVSPNGEGFLVILFRESPIGIGVQGLRYHFCTNCGLVFQNITTYCQIFSKRSEMFGTKNEKRIQERSTIQTKQSIKISLRTNESSYSVILRRNTQRIIKYLK